VVELASFERDVFEMAAPIQSPTDCEVRSVIRFLNTNANGQRKFTNNIDEVYGNVMNRQNVTKWCCEFSEGKTDVHDEQRSCKLCSTSKEFFQEIEGEIRANRRVTIKELHHIILEVS
jgi:hypothetical protein